MQYVYVTSARRNPEQNIRITREEQLSQFYELDKQSKLPSYFVSYTKILKLGINPSSVYDTPLGIYTYPIRYLFKDIVHNTVPFAKDNPYLQIIKRVSDKILCPETFTKADYAKGTKQLANLFIDNRNKVNRVTLDILYRVENKMTSNVTIDYDSLPAEDIIWAIQKRANIEYERLLNDSKRKQAPKANDIQEFQLVAKFWILTEIYAQILSNRVNRAAVGSKSAQVWRTVLTSLGYDCAIDKGFGFIHPNEPCQAVFFTKSALTTIDTLNNNYGKNKSVNKPKEIKRFVNLTEKSYTRLTKQFPVLADIKGYGIYVSVNEAGQLTFSPATKNHKGYDDHSNSYISSNNKTISNCVINISCKNTVLDNCIINQSYCEKCLIRNCRFDNLNITDSELYSSSGKYLEYNRSRIEDCNITGRLTSSIQNSFSRIADCNIATLASVQDDKLQNCNISKILGINRYTNFTKCRIELIKPALTSLENCVFENCSWGKAIDFSKPEFQNYASPSDNEGNAIFINCRITDFYAELAEINPDVLQLKNCESISLDTKRDKVVINAGEISGLTLKNYYIRYPEINNCKINNCIFEQPIITADDKQALSVTHSTLDTCNINFINGGITQSKLIKCNISQGYFYTGNALEGCLIKGGYFYNDYKRHKGEDKRLFYGEPYVLIRNCIISPSGINNCVFERAHFVSCDLSSVDTHDSNMFINCKFE